MKLHFEKGVLALACLLSVGGALAQSPKVVPIYKIAASGNAPALAADNAGAVHAVFVDKLSGHTVTDIFYTASSDAGKTWSVPCSISNTPGDSTEPSIAVENNGSLDAVWTDTSTADQTPDVFFARSTDNGKSWSQPQDISNTPGKSSSPKIVVGRNNSLHVVWCDTSTGAKNQDVYYSSSIDGGEHWGKGPLLPAVDISSTSGLSSEPTVAVDQSGVVHVAWVDTTSGAGRPDIFYAHTVGALWTKPVDVSNSTRKSTHPTITCARGKTYLSWSDNSQKEFAADIWLSVASSRDNRFNRPINLSNTSSVSQQPDAKANNTGWLAVVWSDQSTADQRPHIFARVSLDQASQFSNVLDITTQSAGSCIQPQVALVGRKMLAIWQEHSVDRESVMCTSFSINDIATGPAMLVDPTIRGVPSNQH